MPKSLRLFLALPVVAAYLAIGCGESDEEQVRSVVSDYNGAFARGDAAAACDLMTSSAQALAGKGYPDGCVGSYEHDYRLTNPARRRELKNLKVLSVEIRGDQATVKTSNGLTTPLVKRDGEWLVASLSTLTCDPARADPRCDS